MSRRSRLLSSTVLSNVSGVFLATLTAQAAFAGNPLADMFDQAAYQKSGPAMPAVDGINGKIAPFGGTAGHKETYGVGGSLQFPLGFRHGLQFDPRVGRWGSHDYGELGVHLFWRDPAVALLGLYVRHLHLDRFGGVDATAVTVEGERYWGRWTLQGIVGVEFGNSASRATTSTTVTPIVGGAVTTTSTLFESIDVKTRFTDHINLKYYVTDNAFGYVGHRYQGGKHAFALGGEAVVPVGRDLSTTAFVEARLGEKDFQGVWGGMKFYFGHHGKSLIQRHRENDDPNDYTGLPTAFNSSTTSSSTTSSGSCVVSGEVPVDGVCVPSGGEESTK
jgi:hypothetical protein